MFPVSMRMSNPRPGLAHCTLISAMTSFGYLLHVYNCQNYEVTQNGSDVSLLFWKKSSGNSNGGERTHRSYATSLPRSSSSVRMARRLDESNV